MVPRQLLSAHQLAVLPVQSLCALTYRKSSRKIRLQESPQAKFFDNHHQAKIVQYEESLVRQNQSHR